MATLVGSPDVCVSAPTRAEALAEIQTILQTRVLHGDLVFVETPPQGIAAFAGKYRDDPSLTQIREDIYLARDAELKTSGQFLGLPIFRSNPQTSFGRVPAGRIASQSSGGGISSQGLRAAAVHAGSSSASFPSVPVAGRTQNSTLLSPDGPTMAAFDPQIPALIAMMERDEPSVRKACAEALEGAWPGPGLLPTTLIELGVTMIHGAAAKSLAALDARSKPDGPGK